MEVEKNSKPGGSEKLNPKEIDHLDFLPGWEALEKRLNAMERKPFFRISHLLEGWKGQSFYLIVYSMGVGVLGIGLGILFGSWLHSWTFILLAVGLVMFVLGIFMLHFRDRL